MAEAGHGRRQTPEASLSQGSYTLTLDARDAQGALLLGTVLLPQEQGLELSFTGREHQDLAWNIDQLHIVNPESILDIF